MRFIVRAALRLYHERVSRDTIVRRNSRACVSLSEGGNRQGVCLVRMPLPNKDMRHRRSARNLWAPGCDVEIMEADSVSVLF